MKNIIVDKYRTNTEGTKRAICYALSASKLSENVFLL